MKSSTLGIVAWAIFGTGAVLSIVAAAWMSGGPPASVLAVGVLLVVMGAGLGVAKTIRDDVEAARKKEAS